MSVRAPSGSTPIDQRGSCSALQEVLQAPAPRTGLVLRGLRAHEWLGGDGGRQAKGRRRRRRGGGVGVQRGEGGVWVGLEAGNFCKTKTTIKDMLKDTYN